MVSLVQQSYVNSSNHGYFKIELQIGVCGYTFSITS